MPRVRQGGILVLLLLGLSFAPAEASPTPPGDYARVNNLGGEVWTTEDFYVDLVNPSNSRGFLNVAGGVTVASNTDWTALARVFLHLTFIAEDGRTFTRWTENLGFMREPAGTQTERLSFTFEVSGSSIAEAIGSSVSEAKATLHPDSHPNRLLRFEVFTSTELLAISEDVLYVEDTVSPGGRTAFFKLGDDVPGP